MGRLKLLVLFCCSSIAGFAQEEVVSTRLKNLFGHRLLFEDVKTLCCSELRIAKLLPNDSTGTTDTAYIDTIELSYCDRWELDVNVRAGVWELRGDTLTCCYYTNLSFANDASRIDPKSITTYKQVYIIRRNLQIIKLGVYYGCRSNKIVNAKLDTEIWTKTKKALDDSAWLCN